jgi:hypothetical protein
VGNACHIENIRFPDPCPQHTTQHLYTCHYRPLVDWISTITTQSEGLLPDYAILSSNLATILFYWAPSLSLALLAPQLQAPFSTVVLRRTRPFNHHTACYVKAV